MTTISLDRIDRDGAATRAAAEGKFALGTGDTTLAAEKFAQAATVLEQEEKTARKSSERHLLRFLAASQYYYGGHYQKALKLARHVEERLLPVPMRSSFGPFFRDANERARSDYKDGIEKALSKAAHARDYQRVIDLLKDHPYVLKPGELAYVRAVACEELGEWKVAALFHESAIRFSPGDPDMIASAAHMALRLLRQNRLSEASETIRRQIDLSPHPFNLITASVIAFQKGELDEQHRYFDQAWEAYQRLPKPQQNDPHLHRYMAFGLAGVAKAAIVSRDRKWASEVLERVGLLGEVAESTQRTTEYLRNFLEKNSLAVENLFDVEEFLKSEGDSAHQRLLPPLAV